MIFANENTLSLGVCNGCQFISTLAEIIPGAENWPRFVRNKSERFEARAAMVKINDTNSLWFKRHGWFTYADCGFSRWRTRGIQNSENLTALQAQSLIVAQYIDSHLNVTETYPRQPEWFSIRDYRNF